MEDGASKFIPYAILSVLVQIGAITGTEALSLPSFKGNSGIIENHKKDEASKWIVDFKLKK